MIFPLPSRRTALAGTCALLLCTSGEPLGAGPPAPGAAGCPPLGAQLKLILEGVTYVGTLAGATADFVTLFGNDYKNDSDDHPLYADDTGGPSITIAATLEDFQLTVVQPLSVTAFEDDEVARLKGTMTYHDGQGEVPVWDFDLTFKADVTLGFGLTATGQVQHVRAPHPPEEIPHGPGLIVKADVEASLFPDGKEVYTDAGVLSSGTHLEKKKPFKHNHTDALTRSTLEIKEGWALGVYWIENWSFQLHGTHGKGGKAYDNGTTETANHSGNEMSQWCQADDFELAEDTELCGAVVDWFDINTGNQWDGGIGWTLHADSGGVPGSVVDSGFGIERSTALVGSDNGWDWWTTHFDFDHTVPVSANTRHWLSLHWAGDLDYVRDDVYWAYSDTQTFALTHEADQCAGGWALVTSEDRGFRLMGKVPDSSCSFVRYCNPTDGHPGNGAGITATTCFLGLDVPCEIDAWDVPPGQNGYLIVGTGTGTAQPNQGSLCVIGPGCIGRYNGDVQNSGSAGTFSTDVSSSNTAGPNYALPPGCSGNVQAGETWYFQYWHRLPGGPDHTFSEAICITFQ